MPRGFSVRGRLRYDPTHDGAAESVVRGRKAFMPTDRELLRPIRYPRIPMKFLPGFLRGGRDELGHDDLVRLVARAVATLAHRGARGRVEFPSEALVRVEVASGSVEVVRRMVAATGFDREVAASVANAVDCDPGDVPERDYVVAAGERTRVVASEGEARIWRARIQGGDLDGHASELPSGREIRFGRGRFHGQDDAVPNDLVVSERDEFVSRRAGALVLGPSRIDVTSLGQGDSLVVRRSSGESIRPARTAKGSASLGSGDAIELVDPRGGATVRITFVRTKRSASEDDGSDHT